MTFKDWDEVYKFLEALTKWPPVIVYLALLFRSPIAKKLSGLEKIKVKETEIIFRALREIKKVAQEAKPEVVQQFLLKVPITENLKLDASQNDGKKAEDAEKPGNDQGTDEALVDNDKAEIDQALDSLEDDNREEAE